jgi:large subunit ribosomal protein L24
MRHVRKGDTVEVVAGREKGKRGRVLRIDLEAERVIIEKINLVKRHTRPTQRRPQGGILEKEAGLHVSNVRVVCEKCDKPRRLAAKIDAKGKHRVCGKCGTAVETAAA